MSAPSAIAVGSRPGREVVGVGGHARVGAHPGVAEQVPGPADPVARLEHERRTRPGTRAPGGRPRRCRTARRRRRPRRRLVHPSIVPPWAATRPARRCPPYGGQRAVSADMRDRTRFLRSPSDITTGSQRRSVPCDEVEAIRCWRRRTSARARWGQGSSRSEDRGGPSPSLPSILPSIEPRRGRSGRSERGESSPSTPRPDGPSLRRPRGTRGHEVAAKEQGMASVRTLVVGGARGAGGAARPGDRARARGDGGGAVRRRRRRQAGAGDRGAGPDGGAVIRRPAACAVVPG